MDPFIQMSSLISRKVSVCSDQPLATKAGLDILQLGGNAADAAVATFAAVSVIQPFMCGIGGDIQCLFYRTSNKSVLQINGSGKTGKNTKMERIREAGIKDPLQTEYSQQGLWVSIPGAVAGMFDVIRNFGSGKLTMAEILQPAIKLAEEGVAIPYKAAIYWSNYCEVVVSSKNANDLLINNKPPKAGDVITVPKLAQCYKDIASLGDETFYCGPIANRIVTETRSAGGNLTLEDFKEYFMHPPSRTPSDAVSIDFYGYKIWEMKPNTIGIVALVMLKALQRYDLKAIGHNTAEYIHIVAEVTKFSFLECWDYLCDPNYCSGVLEDLLTDAAADKLKKRIDLNRAYHCKTSFSGGNTSYIAVVDEEGNGCSFIASVSSYFASGLIPDDCGFILNDRLKCMSLEENSPNAYGPNKLSLHTIIPALVTDSKTSDLIAVFGVMGRWMQPQGQVQVLLNMIIFGMDPQTALNQPRFFVGMDDSFTNYKDTLSEIRLEGGIDPTVIPSLEQKGHRCNIFAGTDRDIFGKGHIIARSCLFDKNSTLDSQTTWWSGVDPRSDGYPAGF